MAQLKGIIDANWLKLRTEDLVAIKPLHGKFNFKPFPGGLYFRGFMGSSLGAFNPGPGAEPVPRSVVADVREKALLSYDQAVRRLFEKGWRCCGHGARSEVYSNPLRPNIVVKVNYREDTWPAYILWALNRGELGRKAPMVYSMAPLANLHYVAVMERLEEVSVCEYLKEMDNSDYEIAARRACHDCHGNDGCVQNTMKRANGEVVLTDPWYGHPNNPVKPWSFKKWLQTPSHRLLYPTLSPLKSSGTVTPEQIQPSIKEHGNGWLTGDWNRAFPLASKGPSPAF